MWKPILNQAHFDRLHKTQLHQEKANSMKELFFKIALKNIINFLKTIGLLLKIYTMLPTPSTIKFNKQKALTYFKNTNSGLFIYN